MANQQHQARRPEHQTPQCAWCSGPLRNDYAIVTFPEKDQAVFHLECLDRYRKVMAPDSVC